jgi:glycosyltransferase 2 family protein
MVKWRSLLAGGTISAVCVFLLLRTVDLEKTAAALVQADVFWLMVSLGTIVVAIVIRCWRWQLLFLPHDRVGLWSTISATMIGYMFNTVLPGRVGELARASLVSQTNHVGTPRALGTIVVEKILDVLVLLVLLGVLTAFLPLPPEVTALGTMGAIVFGAAAVVFFVLSNVRGPVVIWTKRYVDHLPVLKRLQPSNLVDMVLGSTDSLRRPRLILLHAVIGPVLWGCALLTVGTALMAFDLQVPWTAWALVLVLTNLGMTVPSAPGYVGVYHGIAVFALTPFGVDPATALAFAVVLHALAFGLFLVGGAAILLAGLAQQHYSVADLWRWRMPAMSDA